MTRDTMSAVVGAHNIPAAIRSLDTLTNPDYADMFTATANRAVDRSPEQWARAVLEDAPLARRFALHPLAGPPRPPSRAQTFTGLRARVEDRRSRR